MAGHVDVYRYLVRLYPKAFRHDFADDLVQNFADLLASDGPSRTWRRIAIDLAVTALVSITTALFPGGAALLLVAAALTVVSANRLARSTRPPDTQRRHHLLIAATTFAATCAISTAVFWIELSNDASWHGGKLLVYNAVFFITAIGALICLVVGLRTPHAPTHASRKA